MSNSDRDNIPATLHCPAAPAESPVETTLVSSPVPGPTAPETVVPPAGSGARPSTVAQLTPPSLESPSVVPTSFEGETLAPSTAVPPAGPALKPSTVAQLPPS